ncbi:MAG: GNAT family N-acetyltransferase [Phycisphaerales bacterium]|nr:MAG: GNAT family N-acetyltransferase [Phycisphaerales bacterium]
MIVTGIKREHAKDVALLHIDGISTGFISSLGADFVTCLYEAIAQSDVSFGFIARDDSGLLGFATLTTNLSRLYRSVVLKKGPRFAALLARKMLSVRRLKKVFETLSYPSRTEVVDLPVAELLSVVVAERQRRKGLATKLIRRSFLECDRRGIEKVKVLVGADNEPANRLYATLGFEPAGQIDSHGVASNIYVGRTSLVLSKRIAEEVVVSAPAEAHKFDIAEIPSAATKAGETLRAESQQKQRPTNPAHP